jgi:hypothetical protein
MGRIYLVQLADLKPHSSIGIMGPIDDSLDHDSIYFVTLPPEAPRRTQPDNALAARTWFATHELKWIRPEGIEWVIDADQLRSDFKEFGDLTWLHGEFIVLPSESPPYVFSLHPFSSRESRMIIKAASSEIHGSLAHFRRDNADARGTAFVLMSFSHTNAHANVLKVVQGTTAEIGIRALRADGQAYHDDLFFNVLTYAYGCDFGIAVFEKLETHEFNPNVALEVGYMLALGRPVCLLKDRTLTTLQADLIGRLYLPFDVQNPGETIPPLLRNWMKDKGFV